MAHELEAKSELETQAPCLPFRVCLCSLPALPCGVGTDIAAAPHPVGPCVKSVLTKQGPRWGCVVETLLGAGREESKGQEGSKRN